MYCATVEYSHCQEIGRLWPLREVTPLKEEKDSKRVYTYVYIYTYTYKHTYIHTKMDIYPCQALLKYRLLREFKDNIKISRQTSLPFQVGYWKNWKPTVSYSS